MVEKLKNEKNITTEAISKIMFETIRDSNLLSDRNKNE
jgi:hypothetical protein